MSEKEFASFLDYFEYVMEHYFRKEPPLPLDVYCSAEVWENVETRLKIAGHCHFPAILNILENDENETVRQLVRRSEYWQLLGRYRDILEFARTERLTFARNEGYHNITLILLFESDPEIIESALRNPAVSLKMIVLFQRYLSQRGHGPKDEQIAEIARTVLRDRKVQIIQLSAIKKAARKMTDNSNLIFILKQFTQTDRLVKEYIKELLSDLNRDVLRRFVFCALQTNKFRSALDHYVVLSELISVINGRRDLWHERVMPGILSEKAIREKRFNFLAEFLIRLLTKKRLVLVKQCAGDLTNLDNIILLSYCHTSRDKVLRDLAQQIMPWQDIITLAADTSTPRRIFRRILDILQHHPAPGAVARVKAVRLQESQRLHNSLRELEVTIQAYFDIIFQSMGYRQINEYRELLHSLNVSGSRIKNFENMLSAEVGTRKDDLLGAYQNLCEIFKQKARSIYYDVSPEVLREMDQVIKLINEIFDLKEMGLESLRPGTPEELEAEIRARARTIWQNALSAYLGRIKDLSEMVREKLVKAASAQYERDIILQDLAEATADLERTFKKRNACAAPHNCKACGRRGCAAERFLCEAHFFMKELLDNFAGQQQMAVAV